MAGKRNLNCRKGNTFNLQFTVSTDNTPWNLTNYSVTMTVKPFIGSTTTILTATVANGLIVLDALNGRVTVTIPATTTDDFQIGRHDYDIVFDSGTVVTTVLEGKFIVTAGVIE